MIADDVTNTHATLRQRIERRDVTVALVGLGYVGLPVACSFASAGLTVRGFDISEARVRAIASGDPVLDPDEPGLSSTLRDVLSAGLFEVSSDPAVLRGADVLLIAVETPVANDGIPQYDALRAACSSVAVALRRDALVVVESTVSPGTTGGLVRGLLEDGSGLRCEVDFYLGHCPERLMPGRLLQNIRSLARVCGGSSTATAELVVALYRHIVSADLDPTDLVTAEIVKTAENAYYDVNIAFANEVALICEELGADVTRVRPLVNRSPGRNMLLAGAGVGGACIPKDPWLLIASTGPGIDARLIHAARAVNDGMPAHVVALTRIGLGCHGRAVAGARVAVLGAAYRENTRDERSSPTETLVRLLREEGAEVRVHDPLVRAYKLPFDSVVAGADAVVLMVAHDAYRSLDLQALRGSLRAPVLIDGRRVVDPAAAKAVGLTYLGIGRPPQCS